MIMRSKSYVLHTFAICLFSLAFCLQIPSSLFAQQQTKATLKGVITDKATGETLPGVNIVLKGTMLGNSTDADGAYVISGINGGKYTIEVSYIGFKRVQYTGYDIPAGETTALNIKLEEEVLTSDEEVIVFGEAPIFDVTKSNSSSIVTQDQIQAAPVRRIDDIIGLQAGVMKDPSGIYIKGGRAYETGFVVDGVSAQDPLAGTGFGLDLGANSFANVEVVTGGVGAEYGDVTSGVVAVKTRDGGDTFNGFFSHKRDNPGKNTANAANFFTDIYEFNLGGPSFLAEKILKPLGVDLPGNFTFFTSGQMSLSDEFTKVSANQVSSSIAPNGMSPRQDNRFSGLAKITWNVQPGMKLQAAYQRSLTVNQNRNMLLITTADVQIAPGFQFPFQENLDNANTYAHDSNLSYVKWTHSVSPSAFYDVQVSRLFTRMRADANGRFWRPDSVDGEFDPESIVTFPVDVLNPDGDFQYALPGSGFTNNGGLATLWHDHFAEEITMKSTITKFFNGKNNRFTAGIEMKFQDYQWIDITRPWVGAPIQIDETTVSQTSRLGSTSDIWRVKPRRGAIFLQDQIRYNGLIANLGVRMEYWAPGAYVDNFIDDERSPIPDVVREQYKNSTFKVGDLRYKVRILPKLRVSFPVRENQVLFFNYGHSARVPHPSFVYAGLDPFYQDRSFLSNLGNPNLDPEMDISYEIGFRNQLSPNDALSVSAFWRDKYDFVTSQSVIVKDPTGRETERLFRVNGDYSRVRGVELTYLKRYKDILQGQLAVTYQRAEGLSSSNNEALRNILVGGQSVINNVETPLAFDRPWDIKGNVTFTWDRKEGLFGIDALNDFRAFMSATYRSGLRYTPLLFRGFERNPITNQADWQPIYEADPNPAARFSEVGAGWFFVDINIQKWVTIADQRFTFFLEMTNLFNRLNPARVNPVNGQGYRTDYPADQESLVLLRNNRAFDVPSNQRDPRYIDARDSGLPRFQDPSNFLQQRHIVFGLSVNFK